MDYCNSLSSFTDYHNSPALSTGKYCPDSNRQSDSFAVSPKSALLACRIWCSQMPGCSHRPSSHWAKKKLPSCPVAASCRNLS